MTELLAYLGVGLIGFFGLLLIFIVAEGLSNK
jgi:hypothetical protein